MGHGTEERGNKGNRHVLAGWISELDSSFVILSGIVVSFVTQYLGATEGEVT